jgi:hypothetical protein
MKRKSLLAVLPALLLTLAPGMALAHHSFAAFFDPTKTVSVTGKFTESRFTNPHGTITLEVTGKDGKCPSSEHLAQLAAQISGVQASSGG